MSQISAHSGRSVLKSITTLQQFKQSPELIAPIYHDAIHLPPFLANNLKANDRRIKEFTGDDALLKTFYFSLMRLAFDLVDGKDYMQVVRERLIGDAEFGTGELEDRNLSDKQYRQFLGQFMDLLEKQGPFEQAIKPYPIVDDILLRMFRQLVPVTLLIRDQDDQKVAERVLSFLSNKFGMQMQVISGCFKLVQPDMFVYVSSLNMVYLVFVEHMEDIMEQEEAEEQSQSDRLHSRKSMTSMGKAPSAIYSTNQKYTKKQQNTGGDVSVVSQRSEKTKGRNFQTVINILDSNRSMGSKESNDKRNSLEGEMAKQAKIDSIKENIEEQCNQYYAQPPSFSHHKDSINIQRSKGLLHPPPEPPVNSPSYRGSNPPSRPSLSSQSSHSISLKSQSSKANPSKSNVSNFCVSSQASHASQSSSQFSSVTPLKASQFRSSSGINEQPKSMVKTYGQQPRKQQDFSKFSSQIYTQGKPSKLGIFSSVAPQKQQIQEESICDDSGYGKFTNSKVLNCLDEQFRDEIKMIKKKYRVERKNLKTYL